MQDNTTDKELLLRVLQDYSRDKALALQGVVGSLCIVTPLEFVTGCIVNLWLGWNVWDYSNIPFNVMGQICLPFSALWVVVSAAAVVLDDWLRYIWFDEERPHYTLFKWGGDFYK